MGGTTASQHQPNALTVRPNGVVRPLGLRQSGLYRARARREHLDEGAYTALVARGLPGEPHGGKSGRIRRWEDEPAAYALTNKVSVMLLN
jgi:hypothetical protein